MTMKMNVTNISRLSRALSALFMVCLLLCPMFLQAENSTFSPTSNTFIIPSSSDQNRYPFFNETSGAMYIHTESSGFIFLNPYKNYLYWYKGQLHCHSTKSDGNQGPKGVEETYRDFGYDFVCLTDHNTVTGDPGVPDILHISCEEDTCKGIGHMLSINIYAHIKGCETQETINSIIRQGGFPVMAHPNWDNDNTKGDEKWSHDELDELRGYVGVEIYNAGCGGKGYAFDKWDYLLTKRRQIWGFATDDCHNINDEGEFNRGWIVVNSNKYPIDKADILQNIKAGNFYAVARSPGNLPATRGSSDKGPVLNIMVTDNVITVGTDNPSTIRFIGRKGITLKTVYASSNANYECHGLEEYVRIEVEQVRSGEICIAYSQPIFLGTCFVDFSASPSFSDCSIDNPCDTVSCGVSEVLEYGTVFIKPGIYPENIIIQKPCQLRRWGDTGSVTIGT